MKKIILLLTLAFVSLSLSAQSNYNEAIQQGDAALGRKDYTTAIKKYLIAKEFAPNKWESVLAKLDRVYTAINKTKIDLATAQTYLQKKDAELKNTNENLGRVKGELSTAELTLIKTQGILKSIEDTLSQTQTALRDSVSKLDTIRRQLEDVMAERDTLLEKLNPEGNKNKGKRDGKKESEKPTTTDSTGKNRNS